MKLETVQRNLQTKRRGKNIAGKLYLLQQYIDNFYLIKMLLWFSDSLTSVEKALVLGHQVQTGQVEAQVQQIPESVVDRNTDVLKSYFSSRVWKTVGER